MMRLTALFVWICLCFLPLQGRAAALHLPCQAAQAVQDDHCAATHHLAKCGACCLPAALPPAADGLVPPCRMPSARIAFREIHATAAIARGIERPPSFVLA